MTQNNTGMEDKHTQKSHVTYTLTTKAVSHKSSFVPYIPSLSISHFKNSVIE